MCNCAYRRFVGTEFALTHAEPPALFVIEKRDRKSPTEGQFASVFAPEKELSVQEELNNCCFLVYPANSTYYRCVLRASQFDLVRLSPCYSRLRST